MLKEKIKGGSVEATNEKKQKNKKGKKKKQKKRQKIIEIQKFASYISKTINSIKLNAIYLLTEMKKK